MAKRIKSIEDVECVVEEIGFLPFFFCGIPGFSLEERIDARHWFTGFDGAWDAWEWKGPIARRKKCVYGKLFNKKAGFVSREWYPDLANWRRDGYDFDALYDDGKAAHDDKLVYDLVDQRGNAVLSQELKKMGGFCKGGKKGFETIITRLQIAQNQADYQKRYDEMVSRYDEAKEKYDKTIQAIQSKHAQAERLDAFVKTLASRDEALAEFDEGVWGTLVEHMTVYGKGDIDVTFKDGTEIRIQ